MPLYQKKVGSSTASSTDGNIALYDGSTGDTIKDSGVPLSQVGINFSYQEIDDAVTITVPLFQQMIVQGTIQIRGNLILIGNLVLI